MTAFWRSVLVVGLSLMAAACGRKGALIYPDMLIPAAPAAVTAQQSGSAVKLQFILPDKDRAGRPVQGVTGVKISRLVAEADQKDVCRSCMTDYLLFRTLYLDHLPADTQRFASQMVLLDSDVSAGKSYSYRIVPFTSDGVDGASSAVSTVRMAQPGPAPVLEIESFPTEVKLQFSAQTLLSGRLLGFNLYRSSDATVRSFQPLNKEPVTGNNYIDAALGRGVKYRYRARAVIVSPAGDIAESLESAEVEGMLKDDE